MNPLKKIAEYGQAIWLDDIHRSLITLGELNRLVDEDGLRGMTSNPAIFNHAFTRSDYEGDIRDLSRKGKSSSEMFEALAVKDVQMAADVFRPLYDRTHGEHGFVSLEVNPHLAHDTAGTLEDARRLWRSLERPNVFIKVPATRAGLPAIEQLIAEGINVNVTLLFDLSRYREVAAAFFEGLEFRVRRGEPVNHVRSVASFFLSRIDALLDPQFDAAISRGDPSAEQCRLARGEVAIASAKVAYQIYRELTAGEHWQALARHQARPQWLLWASTSTKNPQYSDVKYVEPLIGPETVNTLPRETLDAYRDHGEPHLRLEEGLDNARRVLDALPRLGIDLDAVAQQLEDRGVEKFRQPYDQALATLVREMAA